MRHTHTPQAEPLCVMGSDIVALTVCFLLPVKHLMCLHQNLGRFFRFRPTYSHKNRSFRNSAEICLLRFLTRPILTVFSRKFSEIIFSLICRKALTFSRIPEVLRTKDQLYCANKASNCSNCCC